MGGVELYHTSISYLLDMQPDLSNRPHSLLPAITEFVKVIVYRLHPLRDNGDTTVPNVNLAGKILRPLLGTTSRTSAFVRARSDRQPHTAVATAGAANARDGAPAVTAPVSPATSAIATTPPAAVHSEELEDVYVPVSVTNVNTDVDAGNDDDCSSLDGLVVIRFLVDADFEDEEPLIRSPSTPPVPDTNIETLHGFFARRRHLCHPPPA